MSTRGYRVVYDEDACLLERLGAGPVEEIAYAAAHDLLVAYRIDHGERLIQVLSLVWFGQS